MASSAWNGGNPEALLVFVLVYLPVLFFSLFTAWSTTLDRRRAFLRAKPDEMTRERIGSNSRDDSRPA